MCGMRLTLSRKIQEAPDAISFVFTPEKPFNWKAGQFLYYTLKHEAADSRGESRYFTIASAPHEKVIIATTRFFKEGSSFKNALKNFKEGEVIDAFPPDGNFTIESPEAKMLFIAGGIGITPFRSILLDLANKNSIKDIVLIYANKNSEIVYKSELDKIATQNPNLKINYVIEPERADSQKIKELAPDFSQRMFYLSGPKNMIEALKEEVLSALDVDKKMVKTDYFPGY